MALRDALKKIGSVVGDIAKVAFNAIPLVPNIPASSFTSPALATVSGIASGVTDVLGKGALSLIPGGAAVKGAVNIVSSLIPSTKSESKSPAALPSAISTSGYVQNTLAATTKPLSAGTKSIGGSGGGAVPATIGISQQSSAAVQSTGSQIHVPVNGSGIGIFTSDVPPVAVTNTGYVIASAGLVAKAPAGLGNVATLLPTSEPAEKIAEVAGKIAEVANKPTNPTQQEQGFFEKFGIWIFGGIALLIGVVAIVRK